MTETIKKAYFGAVEMFAPPWLVINGRRRVRQKHMTARVGSTGRQRFVVLDIWGRRKTAKAPTVSIAMRIKDAQAMINMLQAAIEQSRIVHANVPKTTSGPKPVSR